ncbi:hypothetical protein DENIS_1969 [Desulfonema ishimotonii]|uniref:Uncharacterized protein n=1 Tax=Desulfonema ishimotonii TaxID=45657 RepID=A0A401FVM3_9BACT|nr:hypothetical protein [Desulfonema ishimotonii]GBC61009.1 hypothetical protein DENIS_1969 [Desulfonema ishimotonii]
MGYAILNIWVRNEKCEVVDRRAHLHIYNCQGTQVLPTTWFGGGHTEVKVPPGCYIITAGVIYGNVYTDKTMVVVGCDEKACVNLVLNRFREQEAKKNVPMIARGCGARIIPPLALHALKAEIEPDELQRALDVIMKAAGMDRREMLAGVDSEIKALEQNMQLFEETELKEVKRYLKSLQLLRGQIG